MEKRMIFPAFLILLLTASFVLAGDPQTTSPQQASQTSNNELAECEENLSILQQQLQELNKTLENITQERDYYKTLYENITVNVTNIELIKIKQNITILNQQIQQLNVSISNIEQRTENLLIKVWYLEVGIGSLIGITAIDHLVRFVHEQKKKEGEPVSTNKNKKEVSNKNAEKTEGSERS